MSGSYTRYPSAVTQAVPTVPTAANLPASGAYDGQLYLTLDDDSLYAWNAGSSSWVLLNSSSTVSGSGANGKVAVWTGGSSLGVSAATGIASLASGALNTTANGTADQIFAMNHAGSGYEYKTLLGTANQVSVAAGAGSLTLSLPQNIATGSSPTFAGLTLSGLSDGILFAASGVLTTGTLSSSDIPQINLAASGNGGVGGILPLTNGGTGQSSASSAFNALSPMTTLGDIIYGGSSGAGTRLAGNTTTTKKFLSQTGNGSGSLAPSWATIASSDVPAIDLASSGAGGVTGVLPYANGGTGLSSLGTAYQLLGINSGATALSYLSLAGTSNQVNIGTSGSTITLSLPQSIGTGSSPTFAGLTLSSPLSIGNGGTGQTTKAAAFDALSPMTTLGDIIYGGASGTGTRLAGNTTANKRFLTQTGTGSVSAAPAWSDLSAPTMQKFTSTGTTTGYVFTVTSANATVGATYTNNGHTYTVLGTIAAGTLLFCSGSSAPSASGTLTKSGGTGDSTISFSANTAIATYTAPSSPAPLYLRVRMAGGGGGGAGPSVTGGSIGGTSYFGTNLLSAGGGGGASFGAGTSTPGGSGTGSLGSITAGFTTDGGRGMALGWLGNSASAGSGNGGASYFGGGGRGAVAPGGDGLAGTAYGSGGGGGASNSSSNLSGAGGGAGAYTEAIISSPSGTYVYAVGAGGAGGAGSESNGGAGAPGILIVEEFYQ